MRPPTQGRITLTGGGTKGGVAAGKLYEETMTAMMSVDVSMVWREEEGRGSDGNYTAWYSKEFLLCKLSKDCGAGWLWCRARASSVEEGHPPLLSGSLAATGCGQRLAESQSRGLTPLIALKACDGWNGDNKRKTSQQIHAQQLPHTAHGPSLPMAPHPGLPGMGPGGLLFGAGLGAGAVPGAGGTPLSAAAAAAQHPLLKPADLHNARDDIKGPSSLSEERLRGSVSPGEREKYRSRSPDVEPELKRRKDDKLGHVIFGPFLHGPVDRSSSPPVIVMINKQSYPPLPSLSTCLLLGVSQQSGLPSLAKHTSWQRGNKVRNDGLATLLVGGAVTIREVSTHSRDAITMLLSQFPLFDWSENLIRLHFLLERGVGPPPPLIGQLGAPPLTLQ
uniref:Uncharacterized protein n=1 Tax=Timema monikensis TaxID=170555 RepID=A0A7R9EB57_9NEOP|nr:unnamed protein product [Timema monikensis]